MKDRKSCVEARDNANWFVVNDFQIRCYVRNEALEKSGLDGDHYWLSNTWMGHLSGRLACLTRQ